MIVTLGLGLPWRTKKQFLKSFARWVPMLPKSGRDRSRPNAYQEIRRAAWRDDPGRKRSREREYVYVYIAAQLREL